MSRIPDLGRTNENLPALVAQYEDDLSHAEANLQIRGKMLDEALKEQGSWPIYYAQRRAELKTLLKYLDTQVSAVRGRLARRYVENYSRQLGERVMNSYIDAEQEYLQMNELYLEIEELYNKYDAVCDAFEKRGFALRDLTTARVHNIQNALL